MKTGTKRTVRNSSRTLHARNERMVATEEKLGITFPNGYKEIDALRQIGDSIRKFKLDDGLDEIAQGMAQFDAVDRNLIREATMQVVELVRENVRATIKIITDGLDDGTDDRNSERSVS